MRTVPVRVLLSTRRRPMQLNSRMTMITVLFNTRLPRTIKITRNKLRPSTDHLLSHFRCLPCVYYILRAQWAAAESVRPCNWDISRTATSEALHNLLYRLHFRWRIFRTCSVCVCVCVIWKAEKMPAANFEYYVCVLQLPDPVYRLCHCIFSNNLFVVGATLAWPSGHRRFHPS